MPNIVTVPATSAFDPSDITISDNTSAAFLVQDSSQEFIRVDTTTGARKIDLETGLSNQYLIISENANYIQLRNGAHNQFFMSNLETTQAAIKYFSHEQVSGGFFRSRNAAGLEMFRLDEDSTTTFTLEEANDGRFRIMGSGSASGGSSGAMTYLDIQSKNNNSASGEYIKLSLEPEAGGRYFELAPSSAKLYCQNAKLDLTTAAATFTLYDDFTVRQYQSGKRIFVAEDAQNSHEALAIDKTSDSTFNLFDINSGVTYAPAAGSNLKVTRRHSSGTADVMTLKGDTDFSYTLKYDSSGTFSGGDAVENNFTVGTDRTGGSAELLKGTTRALGLGEGEGVFFAGPSTSQVWVTGPSVFRVQNATFTHNLNAAHTSTTYLGGTGAWSVTGPGGTFAQIEPDSATTFTLDDGSAATFKVTDDGTSPTNFFSATEGGNTFVDSDSTTFIDSGGATHLRCQGTSHFVLTGGELQMGASGKFVIHQNGYPLYKRSPNLLDLGATTATTVVSLQSDGQYKKIKCTPTASGQTFTLEFQDGTSTNRDYVVEQDFAIHNAGTENCTIQATITSGRGSALGKDLSAGGSTSGELVTGMTLNAGKSALFKAFKWNKDLAGASPNETTNEFMFQTIMVEA